MTDSSETRQPSTRQGGSGQPSSKVAQRDLLMPALTSINNRIYTYEQKLEEWNEVERKTSFLPLSQEKLNKINECKSQLQDILTEYKNLHKQLLQQNRVDSAQLLAGDSLLQLNQQDIDYLEGGCSRLLVELKATTPRAETVAAADVQVKAAFDGADYDRVITLYTTQTASTPGLVPAYETTFQYGQSLLKNHQEALARKVFVDLLARVRLQQGQDMLTFQLMQVIADLDFGTGSYDEARRQYEELVRVSIERGGRKEEWAGLQLAGLQPGSAKPEEMREYSILLKNYLAYTPKRDGYAVAEQAEKFLLTYPASRLVPSANIIHKTTREQAEAWLNQGIKRIEALANERKSQEPQTTADPTGPANPQPLGNQDAIKSPGTSGSNVQTPAAFDEKALQAEYNKGVNLVEAKEYDKAIEGFSKLLRTPYEEKARARIDEAAKLGAQEDRQKAADLFVRASGSRDQETKKKLLLSSRQLLQGILVKYPQSGLNDKVQKNLSRIEEELKAIDSSPVTAPPSKGGAYVPPASTP
jgi:TolA-binding protein